MLISIQSEFLRLTVDSIGAQMMELCAKNGRQYLWDGNPAYWKDRAPVLFPFVGRLTENRYLFRGAPYSMGIHGFAAASEFHAEARAENTLLCRLTSNQETLRQYPFSFVFEVQYRVIDRTVEITYAVENHSALTMPFAVGGHPGFRVPFEEGASFEDYVLQFTTPCRPERIGFTGDVFLSGRNQTFALEEDRLLHLRHALFDEDAIVLQHMSREVRLFSGKTSEAIRVSFPDLPYLGLWHMPRTDAGYLCIEPWSSLPARQNIVEELHCRSDMLHLAPGNTYQTRWSVTIEEK